MREKEMIIEAVVQVVLLVCAVFAFSYIAAELFDSVQIVSAKLDQEENQELTTALEEEGIGTNYEDPEAGSQATNDLLGDIGSGVLGEVMGLVSGFIPEVAQIAGGLFQSQFVDTTGGAMVCPITKEDVKCQPMIGNDCEARCDVECLDGIIDDLPEDSECSLGTCIDLEEGTCVPRSPKGICEEGGGDFRNSPMEAIPECALGCCQLVDQALFVNERRCIKMAKSVGLEMGTGANFDSDIVDELSCLGSVYNTGDGACTFLLGNDENLGCRFGSQEECDTIPGGMFNEGVLCSNEDLETICERQVKADCVEGLDEIYWFDSCGNRENIYEADKDESFNDGEVLKKEDSCVLGNSGDPVSNQETCGNCNRLASSYCGDKIEYQELDDNSIDVVCLDRGCVDPNGIRRENGESWCAYQGQIGLAGPDTGAIDLLRGIIPELTSIPGIELIAGDRAVDTPGSTHFRKSCLDGEINTAPCANFRNEICVEDRTENEEGGEFAQAACRINRWQECLAYNPSQTEGRIIGLAGEASGKILKAKLMATCGLDPDCFVKDVNVDTAFQFSYCAPRYPPGFDTKDAPEAAEQICAQATQMCTVIYVNKLGSGWTCERNCECEEQTFAKQLNELCTSLGDCGSTVNYVGNPGVDGYSVSEGKQSQVIDSVISGLLGDIPWISGGLDPSVLFDGIYAEPIPGEYVQANPDVLFDVQGNWVDNIFEDIGIGDLFSGGGGGDGKPDAPEGHVSYTGAAVVGGIGSGIAAAAWGSQAILAGGISAQAPLAGTLVTLSNPSNLAFGGALMGAAAGLAITGFLIDVLGIGPGLSPAVTYGLMAAGATGGLLMGLAAVSGKSLAAVCTGSGGVGCIIMVVVIIIIIFLSIMGIGDIDEREITFTCKPWAPPLFGDCESCGNDKLSDGGETFPCNKYACEALGQACEYSIETEGPEGGICISVEKSDASAPKIVELDESVLSDGFEYGTLNDAGFEVKKQDGNGCVDQFSSITFGFILDEHGRCGISGSLQESYAEMIPIGGGLSKNHIMNFNSLDLSSLGISYIQNEINNLELYLACQDYLDNDNVENPYVIEICVDPDDLTPPLINSGLDITNTLPFDAEGYELVIGVNEPSECRWSVEDVPFDQMTNNLDCETDLEDRFGGQFQCTGNVPIENDVTEIFIRCKDHPELAGTGEDQNENVDSVKVTIIKSGSALEISSITPGDDATIYSGTIIPAIEVIVQTSGGVDGTADCLYSIDKSGKDLFMVTGGNVHKQILGAGTAVLGEGSHELELICEDSAGNIAEGEATFNIVIDHELSNIARVYDDGGTLTVITDEPSTCAFTFEGCGFSVSEGDQMSSSSGDTKHTTSFDGEKTYHIKCRDQYNNEKISECDIIVSGSLF
jgi:hypothetical protein